MKIVVIDGQGGGIGKAVVERMKKELPQIALIALGTNSMATGQMLRAGADEGATGENAIVHNTKDADIIIGVIGILVANSMLGELSPKMAEAIGSSTAYKVLLPLNRCHIEVVSTVEQSMSAHIDNVVHAVKTYLSEQETSLGKCSPLDK